VEKKMGATITDEQLLRETRLSAAIIRRKEAIKYILRHPNHARALDKVCKEIDVLRRESDALFSPDQWAQEDLYERLKYYERLEKQGKLPKNVDEIDEQIERTAKAASCN